MDSLVREDTITAIRWRKWFALFKSRVTSLEDKPRRGRPSDFDGPGLCTAVETDESLTNRMLAFNSRTDHSAIVCRLKKLEELLKLIVTTFRIKCLKYLCFLLHNLAQSSRMPDNYTPTHYM
uniref:Uncharacterized protein n=1 Tax=Glossina austeni TaxID=7395 RepID=A0A1A9UVS9_GLOAU